MVYNHTERDTPWYKNFVLQFCPTHPSDQTLMERLGKIGVGPGKSFDVSRPSLEQKKAIVDGMADAWNTFGGVIRDLDASKVSVDNAFGSREFLKGNYLLRMAGAAGVLYGSCCR
jgi:hypothetical protein